MEEATPWAEDTPNRRGFKFIGRQIAATTAGGVAGAALNKLGGHKHPYLPLATGAAASLADLYTQYKQRQSPRYGNDEGVLRGFEDSNEFTISPGVTEGVKKLGRNIAFSALGGAAGAAVDQMGGSKHPFLPLAASAAASLADWYTQYKQSPSYPKTLTFAKLNEELKKGQELPDWLSNYWVFGKGLDADYLKLQTSFQTITESMQSNIPFVKDRPADRVDEKLQRELFENTLSWAHASLKRHQVTDEHVVLYSYFLLRCLTVVSTAFPDFKFEKQFQIQVDEIIRLGFPALTYIFRSNYAEAYRIQILEYCGLMKDLMSRHFQPFAFDTGFHGISDLQGIVSRSK